MRSFVSNNINNALHLASICFAAVLATAGHAANYYVAKTGNDSSTGSQSQPWLTITKAAQTVAAGDIVNIGPGTYAEDVVVAANGTSSLRILFTGPSTAIVRSIALTGSYITVSGIGIGTTQETVSTVFQIKGANDTAIGCFVNLHGVSGQPTSDAFDVDGANDVVQGCDVTGVSLGTNFNVSGSAVLISGNKIHDEHDSDAFRLWGTGNILRGNEVYNLDNPNQSLNHADFVQTFANSSADVSKNHIIENNYVHDCKNVQVGNLEMDGQTVLGDWTFRNNVFARVTGALFVGIPRCLFYNNLWYKSGTDQEQPIIFYEVSPNYNSNGCQLINNIFLASGAPQAWNGCIGSNFQSFSTFTIKNNYFAGPLYAAKDATQATVGTSYVNGGNPLFVNESADDFHLTSGSPLIGKGANLSTSFAVDKDGNTRPASGSWSVGPYELNGSPTPTP